MTDGAYRATLERLYQRRRFGLKPGLEVIQGLLDALGHPERSLRAIHVTGSKGKGSVAALASALLTASGRRTGLFISPHLQSFRERIQVDRVPLPPEAVVDGVARIEAVATDLERAERIPHPPTFFEITTALAFDWFHHETVEDVVIEVGLGGRLDATNVLPPGIGVITTIELEHTDILGPTLTDVAREKAGILHPGMRGIVGTCPPEARREIERHAQSVGVRLAHLGEEVRVEARTLSPRGQRLTLTTPSGSVDRIDLPLQGPFQAGNAALALAAAEAHLERTGAKLSPAAVRRGFAHVAWRARVERVARRPDLYVDVAHTPQSARAVAESLAEILPFSDPAGNVLLFGCLADKRFPAMFESLAPLAHTVVVVPVRSERSAAAEDLRRAAAPYFRRVVLAPTPALGLALARSATLADGYTLVVGSDYLAGEVLDCLEGRARDEPDLSDPGRMIPTAETPRGGGSR